MLLERLPDTLDVRIARTPAYDAAAVTIVDQAHVEPPTWWSVDLATATATEVHRAEAPGHDAARYVTTRMTFPAPDGTPVPATVVRHRDTPLDGTAPALLYAYGAYESVYPDQEWDPAIPSLLDRGVVYVHAHVRGGGEGGRRWWLDGRLEHKQHTFDDHLAVADGLVGISQINHVALVAGSHDLYLEATCRDQPQLIALLDEIRRHPGVASIQPIIVTSLAKDYSGGGLRGTAGQSISDPNR